MTRRAWPFHDDQSGNLPVAIVDTGVKRLAVAAIVANYASDTVDVHGQACIDLLGRAVSSHGLHGTLHKVEIATDAGAAARVEMVIASADDGDSIVFMCADAAIFNIAWRALEVRKW